MTLLGLRTNYTNTYINGDNYIYQRDSFGTVGSLYTNITSGGQKFELVHSDAASNSLQVSFGPLLITVYAVNGVVCLDIASLKVRPVSPSHVPKMCLMYVTKSLLGSNIGCQLQTFVTFV
jgi:hypothetical protein